MLYLHSRWLGTLSFNIFQYGFSFASFWKNWQSGSNNDMERRTNVRFVSKPFLLGGNLSLKSTAVFSSVYLGHCSSVFLRQCSSVFLRQCSFIFLEHCSSVFLGHCRCVFLSHCSGVLLRHSRRSNCISIDPFCIPASISQFSRALIILNCSACGPTN